MKKSLPHGESNFGRLIRSDCYYIDRTQYIPLMEKVSNKNLFFLRPRKFGKSLFVSMLQHYYGIEFKDSFSNLFSNLHVGANPTHLANSYCVLLFDFSGVSSSNSNSLPTSMNIAVLQAIKYFNSSYDLLSADEIASLGSVEFPSDVLKEFFSLIRGRFPGGLYIMVDEYDHFTNELLVQNMSDFKSTVSGNGFVRKFYEVIKSGVRDGVVERFFATGVTPVSLDSMTSGFNIAVDLTLDKEFNEMLGFTESEVEELLLYYDIPLRDAVLTDMRQYYNGSLFSKIASQRVYNSNMVLYFLDSLLRSGTYPGSLTDNNIASDYGKISNLIELSRTDDQVEVIDSLFSSGEVASGLTTMFSFERTFTKEDLVSLLFFHGLLTIKEPYGQRIRFTIPNYAIKELYWDFIREKKEHDLSIQFQKTEIDDDMYEFIYQEKPERLVAAIEKVMAQLSNRDLRGFKEKDLKIMVLLLCRATDVLIIESEVETGGGYIDLLITGKSAKDISLHYCLELKYTQSSKSEEAKKLAEMGFEQAKRYCESLNRNTQYTPMSIAFSGKKGTIVF